MTRPGVLQAVIVVIWTSLCTINCLYCISDYCRSIDGCQTSEDNANAIRCPEDASCFLQVKIQPENGMPVITERSQGCATLWSYMKAENGSRTCFDGPNDQYRTCLCSNGDYCNRQLSGVSDYRRLRLEEFPPASTRKIDCIESGVVYSTQAYCTYRRNLGGRYHWTRRAHSAGYVSLLEMSPRDHLCFQDEKVIDCYCKTDRCNEAIPPPNIIGPLSFIGVRDDKVTCCRGDIDVDQASFQGAQSVRRCVSNAVCTGDYCFIKYKYNKIENSIVGRQTCYNTSSEVVPSHGFEGAEYGPYRERVLYCRRNFCNELATVVESISAAERWRSFLWLWLLGLMVWRMC